MGLPSRRPARGPEHGRPRASRTREENYEETRDQGQVELRARTAAPEEKPDVNFDKQNRNYQVDREQESGEPR